MTMNLLSLLLKYIPFHGTLIFKNDYTIANDVTQNLNPASHIDPMKKPLKKLLATKIQTSEEAETIRYLQEEALDHSSDEPVGSLRSTLAPTISPSFVESPSSPLFPLNLTLRRNSTQNTSNQTGVPNICDSDVNRTSAIRQIVQPYSIDKDVLNDMFSSPKRALKWIANDDPLQVPVCNTTKLKQRYGLALLYYDADGDMWIDQDGWLSEKNECEWYGIGCSEDGFVVTIDLVDNNLSGTIPNEIYIFSSMLHFSIPMNNIQGTIPTTLSRLSFISALDLFGNFMTGTLPESIYLTDSLALVEISSNNFEGSISPNIAKMKNLTRFWAADNELTGSIPSEIGLISKLEQIILYGNRLSGMVPTTIGSIQKNLDYLDLMFNSLAGKIPSQIYNATSLSGLFLSYNALSGSIQNRLGNLTNLKDLWLDNNFLSGSFPSTLGNLQSLDTILLNDNMLTRTIPSTIGLLEMVRDVGIHNNGFSGSIPSSFYDLEYLERAYLFNNSLTGTISPQIWNMQNLEDLYLYGNFFIGTIPGLSFDQILKSGLVEVILHDNDLTGEVPDSMCYLFLTDLVADCRGPLPQVSCVCCSSCF